MADIKKILVLGAFGYVGSAIAQFFLNQGNNVILATRETKKANRWMTVRGAKIITIDWNNLKQLEELCSKVDVIIHAAGISSDSVKKDPLGALKFITEGTANLLNAAGRAGSVSNLFYISSAHVYSGNLSGRIMESDLTLNPEPYAIYHRSTEIIVETICRNIGINPIILRLSNSYGSPAVSNSSGWSLAINNFCMCAAREGKIILHSSGSQYRDFVHIGEIPRAIAHLAAVSDKSALPSIFNLGGECALTINQAACLIAERFKQVAKQEIKIIHKKSIIPGPECQPLEYSIDELKKTGFSLVSNIVSEIDLIIKQLMQ